MKKRIMRSVLAYLLTLTMFLGITIYPQTVYAGPLELVDTTITDFTVTTTTNQIPPDGFSLNSALYMNITWDASSYGDTLKNGDFFIMKLPKEFIFPSDHAACNFQLYAPDGHTVLANAIVTPEATGGGIIRVTFTNWVEGKIDISGGMKLNATFNQTFVTYGQNYTIALSIGSFIKNLEIKIKENTAQPLVNELLTKWAYNRLTPEGYVSWQLRLNHKKANYHNVYLSDELQSEDGDMTGIHYIPNSFVLKEVEMDEYGRLVRVLSETNISDQVVLSENDTKFTYNMGTLDGKQYRLGYYSTFRDNVKLKNRATLSSTEETIVQQSNAVFAGSGGHGHGTLESRIVIIKRDAKTNAPLPDAKFSVTNTTDGSTFTLITDTHGKAVSSVLNPGSYTIREIKAPDGYVLDATPITAEVLVNAVCEKEIFNTTTKPPVKPKPGTPQEPSNAGTTDQEPTNQQENNADPSDSGASPSIYSDPHDMNNEMAATAPKLKHLPKTGDGIDPRVYAVFSLLLGSILILIGIRRKMKGIK